MFDVGFQEFILIGVIALIVVGPERLPGVARTAGKWLGKGKRFLSDVKSDIDQELKAEELKNILEVQRQNKPLQEIIDASTDSFESIKKDTENMFSDLDDMAAEADKNKAANESKKS